VVTICTASLTFNNSTFCPHTVFMCFVWIWEQTAIISLYSIHWLILITETVFTARYDLNLTLHFKWILVFGPAIAQTVSRRLFTVGAQFNPRSDHESSVAVKVALWQVFHRVIQFSPASITPPLLTPHTHIQMRIFSLHPDTTLPQPNHTVTPTHIEPEQHNTWNKSAISHKLLKMDVLTFETCWAINSEIIKQVTSSWSTFIRLSRLCTVQ
jgi:hypothetical protein